MVNETPQHKLILVEDIGRDLNPIGYGFKSPIMSPFKAPIDIVRRLLGESGVTRMVEVYEKDHTLRVKLTSANFRQSFEQIWKEQNPGKEFPWEVGVTDIKTVVPQTEVDNIKIEVDTEDPTLPEEPQTPTTFEDETAPTTESDEVVSDGDIVVENTEEVPSQEETEVEQPTETSPTVRLPKVSRRR